MKNLIVIIALACSAMLLPLAERNPDAPFGVIDDSYEVNASGAYNHIIPLHVPPGVHGMIPGLAVVYDSRAGLSEFGYGWALTGLSKIVRVGNNYAQHGRTTERTFTSDDAFLMDGQYLSCVEGTNGKPESGYRTENETFSVIRGLESVNTAQASPKYFLVKHQNGMTYYYGNTDDSRLEVNVGTDHREVLEWNVSMIRDPFGNYISFQYEQFQNTTRIKTILYTGNERIGLVPKNKVIFNYAEATQDKRKTNWQFVSGIPVLNDHVVQSIGMSTNGSYFKYYHFLYDNTKLHLLQVKESTDEAGNDALPPTVISWNNNDTLTLAAARVLKLPIQRENNNTSFLDVDNNGSREFAVLASENRGGKDSTVLKIYAAGASGYETPVYTRVLDDGNATVAKKIRFADIDGDGRKDLVTNNNIYLNTSTKSGIGFTAASWNCADCKGLISRLGEEGKLLLMDLDGDSRSEVVLYDMGGKHTVYGFDKDDKWGKVGDFESPFYRYFMDDFSGIGKQEILFLNVAGPNEIAAGVLKYDNQRARLKRLKMPADVAVGDISYLQFQDINNDGIADLVMQKPNEKAKIWLNTGNGFVGAAATTPCVFGNGGNPRATFGHFTSGEYVQLLSITADAKFSIWNVMYSEIGQCQFVPEAEAKLKFPADIKLFSQFERLGFEDFDNDGTTDVTVTPADKPEMSVYLNGNRYNDLVTTVTDGFANIVRVSYTGMADPAAYSTSEDQPAPNYNYYWGPYTLVKSISYTNGLKNDSLNYTAYTYQDLMYELRGRGMAGFRTFSKTESNTGTRVTTAFDYKFPLTGKIIREIRTAKNGVEFFRQTNTWQTKLYKGGVQTTEVNKAGIARMTAFNRSGISYLPVLSKSEVTQRELDNKPVSKSLIENTYNNYGEIVQTATTLGDNTVSFTQRAFVNFDGDLSEGGNYMLGLLGRETTFICLNGDTTRSRVTAYDYYAGTGALKTRTRQPGDALYEQRTSYRYDNTGNLTVTQLFAGTPDQVSERFDYTPDRRFLAAHINTLGYKKTYVYESRYGLLKEETDINGLTTQYEYDAFGNMKKQTFPDGRYKSYDYSFLTTEEDFFHGRESNALYKLYQSESGSKQTVFYYDRLGREVGSMYYLLDTSLTGPATLGRRPSVFARDGKFAERLVFKCRKFDNRGNLSEEFKPEYVQAIDDEVPEVRGGDLRTTRIKCIQFEDSTRMKTTYAYDDFNRLVTLKLADGGIKKTEYTANKVIEYDMQQHRKIIFKNAKGLLDRVVDDQGNTVTYGYDLWGNLTEVRNMDGSAIITRYDLIGRKKSVKDPALGTVSYEYDAFDRISKETTNGTAVRLEYDKAGRLLRQATPEGVIRFAYDQARRGNLDTVTDQNNNRDIFQYDGLGRLVKQTKTVGQRMFVEELSYDSLSRLRTKMYPGGFKVIFGYQNNILTDVTDAGGKKLWQINTVDAEGKILKKTLGNGLETRYAYNRYNSLIEQIVTQKSKADTPPVLLACAGDMSPSDMILRAYEKPSVFPPRPRSFEPLKSLPTWSRQHFVKTENDEENWKQQFFAARLDTSRAPVQNLSYRYNDGYNVGTKVDMVRKVTEEYIYDNLNRLVKTTRVKDNNKTEEEIAYDAYGNIQSKTGVGVYQYDDSRQRVKYVNNQGKLNHQFYYDSFGNMLGDSVSGLQISYTSFNKPLSIKKGKITETISYGYDNSKLRSIRTENGVAVTTYYPFPDCEVVLNEGNEIVSNTLYLNGEPVLAHRHPINAGTQESTVSYLHTDHLGSVTAVTNESGSLIAEYDYTSFGERTVLYATGNTQSLGYTAQQQEDAFGLINFKGRYYMPVIGRFISPDPFINSVTNAQGLNRYSYVFNNPVNNIDPSGYIKFPNPVKIVKEAVHAVGNAVENVGRAVGKAAEAYVGLYVKAFEEGERFAHKYGKQIVMVAAAVAITYLSGGSMAGLGMAMLQGALIGGGISAGITAIKGGSFSDILNAGFSGAITGAAVGALSYGLATGANKIFDGAKAGKHVLGGVNGYITSGNNHDEGFVRGVAASFIPADLGATEAFENSKTANFLLSVGSAAARGYVINGEEGMKMQVCGSVATMAAGHLAALYVSGGNGYSRFQKGVYVYKSNAGSFSVGGAIALQEDAWNPGTGDLTSDGNDVLTHEMTHFSEQNTLGAVYLPVHAPRVVGESYFQSMETDPFHSEAAKGGYTNPR